MQEREPQSSRIASGDRQSRPGGSRPISRKAALLGGAAFAASAAGFSCGIVRSWVRDFDLIIEGGEICDGSGRRLFDADVGIRDGRILAVGKLKQQSSSRRISARGLVVAPGFIDLHTHSDTNLLVDGRAWSKVFQGVTTEIVGQDGRSVAPLTSGMRRGRGVAWQDFAGYHRSLVRRGTSVHVLSMVGAGTLREYVMGRQDTYAEPFQIRRMQLLFQRALEQGARHLSSGLEYQPGSFASDAELVGILEAVPKAARRHLVYATHMRNEDDRIESALQEAITIARWAGVRLHISHFKMQGRRNWDRLPGLLDMVKRARRSGVPITFDRYPYVAYSTGLQSLFPAWSRDGSHGRFLGVLRNGDLLPRLRRDVEHKIASLGSYDSVQIARLYVTGRKYEGRRLGELAAAHGQEPFEFLRQLMLREKGGGSMVGFGMNEDNTDRILRDRFCAIASDGSARAVNGVLGRGMPHPRNFGTFPRVLGHYVRERRAISLREAVRKMTSLPASILGLKERGQVRPGYHADLVLFDPDTVADRATFLEPKQYSRGIRYVIVGGTVVVDGGDHTDARPGRVLGPDAFANPIL